MTPSTTPWCRWGGIDKASACLVAGLLLSLGRRNGVRAERAIEIAKRIEMDIPFVSFLAPDGSTAVRRRLALVAPTQKVRDATASARNPLGATRIYLGALDRLQAS